jgi:hypothetical protein
MISIKLAHECIGEPEEDLVDHSLRVLGRVVDNGRNVARDRSKGFSLRSPDVPR